MRCTTCGSEQWEQGATVETMTVDGRTFEAELAADLCKGCSERLVSLEELGRFEAAIAAELARDGARSGEAMKFMRKAIGLRAVDLANLLDVAPETISRWETGEREAPRAHVALLGALVLDHVNASTATRDRLAALHDAGRRLAPVVHLHLRAHAEPAPAPNPR